MSRAASSSTGDTKSFWRRPRLSSSQCNATGANRFSGPAIRVAAPTSQIPSQRLAPSSPHQLSSDEEDEELRSFLTIREPIPRHAGVSVARRGGRDDSPSSPASSFDSTRLSPWSTPTSPRWSGSTTPPGSSSLEGHSPGLSASLSSSPFSDASVVISSSCGTRKHTRGDCHFPKSLPSSASASSSPGCKLNALGDPPPPCNIWSGGFKWHDQIRGGTYKDREECLQISDFWKYGQHRRSSDFSSDAESRRGDDVLNSGLQGTRRASSFDALEVESDDSSVDALRGARPKLILPVPKHSPPKNSGFPDPSHQKPTRSGRSARQDDDDVCCHCKLPPSLLPLECCEQDVRSKGDAEEPLGSCVGSKKGLNWPCTLQPPNQRCLDCLYSVPLSSGAQWVQASCGKFPWNRRRGSGVLVHEVDEGQPCLTCKDKCPGFSPHLWSRIVVAFADGSSSCHRAADRKDNDDDVAACPRGKRRSCAAAARRRTAFDGAPVTANCALSQRLLPLPTVNIFAAEEECEQLNVKGRNAGIVWNDTTSVPAAKVCNVRASRGPVGWGGAHVPSACSLHYRSLTLQRCVDLGETLTTF
ncbi:hypothetical protein HPB51_024578 [Rhipicephalus microplus]|uniref:Uncharacterized protein n=1 Tax=Rhipicephalus microplus TaxID=6941 RepID=A0A9J6DK25_RHIMP|nr:hypothetical protein HPB51_024578 [Rhipicephalus microplus]